MIKVLKNNRLVKAFFQMSGAGVIVQLLALLLTPILSRLYTPDDFSIFGILVSITSLFSIISSLKYDFAFFIEKKHLRYFFIICLICIFITIVIASFILPSFYNYHFVLFFITLFSASIYNITMQFSVAKSYYRKLSTSRILQGVIQYSLALCLGFYYFPKGLIYSFIMGQLIAGIFLSLKLNISFKNVSYRFLGYIFKKNATYCANSTFTSALQWSTPLTPMLVGGFIYSSRVLGVYFLISQAISAITSILRRSLINICTSELNTPYNFNTKLSPLLKQLWLSKGFKIVVLLTIASLLFIHIYSKEIIITVFGNEWVDGSKYLSIIVFFGLFDILLYPFIHLLNLWGKYIHVIILELFRFACVFLILPAVTYYYQLDFSLYIFMQLFCMFIFNAVTFIFLLKISKFKTV